VAQGEAYLVLAYCPFPEAQPYAEVGPIFLHAEPCGAYRQNGAIPAMYLNGEPRILRGYNRDNRIIYGTGKVVPPRDMARYAGALLGDPAVGLRSRAVVGEQLLRLPVRSEQRAGTGVDDTAPSMRRAPASVWIARGPRSLVTPRAIA
jgi:hypothetical protein